MDDEDDGVGVGVFFSSFTAVTADHNLTVDQVLGTKVLVKIPGNGFHVVWALRSQAACVSNSGHCFSLSNGTVNW